MKQVEKTLNNFMWIPIVLTIGFLGWFTGYDTITIPILAIYCLLTFIFCNDVKNIFPIVFSAPFLITNIENQNNLVGYGTAIVFFVIGAIFFIIKQFKKKTQMRKGKLFWALIIADIAFALGGIFQYFNFSAMLITMGLSLAIYFLYFLAINFCPDFKLYINYSFITIGLLLFSQLIIAYFSVEESFLTAITTKSVIFIGVQHINVVAIYFAMAMISAFQLGCKHKFDYLYTLLAVFFAICTYFTYSRMLTLIGAIFLIIGSIIVFTKSQNKRIFIFIGLVLLTLLIITFTAFYDRISKFLEWHLTLGVSGNGRDELWPWCIEKFKESPWFGIGFVSDDPVPTLISTDYVVLAHNTILQYLTSVGVIGTIMVGYLYVKKYMILLKDFNLFKLFNLLQILMIGLSGITDQAATMDFFIFAITIIFISLAENDTIENPTPITHTIKHNHKDKKSNENKETLAN